MKKYNQKIDVIIPAYNVPDNILFRCLASIACQDIISDIEVTSVDDASTEQNYLNVIKSFENIMSVKVLRYDINKGPGVARQYGIDNTSNGYLTFIDADDTFNGAFALKALRLGIEQQNGIYQMCVGVFDEIHETDIPNSAGGPLIMPHENDLVWMFGKMYRRSFIDKYNIHFHESSRANEDNGFNRLCQLCCNGNSEQINFIPTHVYYWHENINSITRINDCEYSFGAEKKHSFYGYVENMIFAIKEAKKRNPYNGYIDMWNVNCLMNIYEYYVECLARSPKTAEGNLEWCKWYYNEVFKDIEKNLTKENLAKQYNEVMRNAYLGNKLDGIIPNISIFEFLDTLKTSSSS